MNAVFLAAVIGIGIGIVVGALGAGGGILAVPVLVYLLDFAPHDATAASLIIVAFTAVVALRHPMKSGNVAWREGLTFGAIAIAGAALASRTSLLIPERILMLLFGALLFAVSFVMVRRALRTRREENALAAGEPSAPALGREELPAPAHGRRLPVLIAAAAITGILTGLFGVGGGFLAVPMLMIAVGLPMRRATGTSLVVMIMSSISALVARLGTPTNIDFLAVALFALGSALGGALGGPIAARARPSTLTFCFAGLLFLIGTFTLITNVL